MIKGTYRNIFNDALVTITGTSTDSDGVVHVWYERTVPVQAGAQTISEFSKPKHAFLKAYEPVNK